MARFAIVIFFVVIIISIVAAMYAYNEYQPNFVNVKAGEPIVIGPVKYMIEYEGIHNGDKETKPEHSFIKIRIIAENLNSEDTSISGGQFHLLDKNNKKHEAVYGKFSSEDLFVDTLVANKPKSFTTQFDAEFDEKSQYKIGITPRKEQASQDIGIICILNC